MNKILKMLSKENEVGLPTEKGKRTTLFVTVGLCVVIFVLTAFGTVWLKYLIIGHNIDNETPIYDENRIYYSALSAREQLLYDEILLTSREIDYSTVLLPYTYSEDEFSQVITALRAENPELFYVCFEDCALTLSSSKSRVDMQYCTIASEIEGMLASLNDKIDEILAEMDAELGNNAGEFEREAWLHDYIILNTADLTADITQSDMPYYKTAYGALVLGHADAEGYSAALALLLSREDIFALPVYGVAESGGESHRHVWNIVCIDDKYYHTDVTWDDANINYAPDIRFHGYFNLSYAMISRDHTADNVEILPRSDTENTYYNVNGLYAKDEASLAVVFSAALERAVSGGTQYIELYPSFTRAPDVLYEALMRRLTTYNIDKNVLKNEIRIYNASATSNAVTVEIFYN